MNRIVKLFLGSLLSATQQIRVGVVKVGTLGKLQNYINNRIHKPIPELHAILLISIKNI